MGEKIAEVIAIHFVRLCGHKERPFAEWPQDLMGPWLKIADLVLALPVGTRKERCPIRYVGITDPGWPPIKHRDDCQCNGSGQISTPLTLAEALETLKEIVDMHNNHHDVNQFVIKMAALLDGMEVTCK